jgi:sugar lactone lactonase YvrE
MVGVAVPRASGGYALAVQSGFRLLDADGVLEQAIPVEAELTRNRMNDGKCDPQGRFWAGTLSLDLEAGAGALYRLDADRSVRRVLDGVSISNGLDWSPDGEVFYFIDSQTRGVDAFDFDGDTGELANRRRVVTLDEAYLGIFDGMTVDDEGSLWIAVPIEGRVLRYSPEGELLAIVDPPVMEVTSCAFGSADRGDLFITSATEILSPELVAHAGWDPGLVEVAEREEHRGALFRCRPGCTGPAARPYAG